MNENEFPCQYLPNLLILIHIEVLILFLVSSKACPCWAGNTQFIVSRLWLWELTKMRSAQERLVLLSGTARVDSSTNRSSTDRISGQFLFYHDHYFIKSKENLRFRRLVPLFVPIGVCVTTHGDSTASNVTIGMWRHDQQAMNHECKGETWFSLLGHVIYKWWHAVE